MSACTFFGHRNSPETVQDPLKKTIVDLIENCFVNTFYVGTQGNFDRFALRVLREVKKQYPWIVLRSVLAYMPGEKKESIRYNIETTILPEGIELIHPKFAISWRNRWMVDNSEYVICYVVKESGGAAQFAALARRKKKHVINLAEIM